MNSILKRFVSCGVKRFVAAIALLVSIATVRETYAQTLPERRPLPQVACRCPRCGKPLRCAARREEAIWSFSTFHLPRCPPARFDFCVRRYAGNGQWIPSSTEAFLATNDPLVTTFIYIPAARVTTELAHERAVELYHKIVHCAPAHESYRMIVWSWPNDKSWAFVDDFRQAACRADTEGFYLGWLLMQFHPASRTSLLSYSLSGWIACGALHVLGGGELRGRCLPIRPGEQRTRVRAVFWSPGAKNDFLCGGRHSEAYVFLDRMLLLYNPNDPILKRFSMLSPKCSPVALGCTGLACPCCSPVARLVDQYDVSSWLGGCHTFRAHIESPRVLGLTQQYLLWRGKSDEW